MERVGIAHYADKRADTLSGGERQRSAWSGPDGIRISSWPTSRLPLDPKTSTDHGALVSLTRTFLPVLINIHNCGGQGHADRIVGRHGRIIFDAEPAALDQRAMDEIYAGVPAEERGNSGQVAVMETQPA